MADPAPPELPPPATTAGRTRVAGADVAWERWARPGAPPVVLVHGTAAHGGWWHHTAPALAVVATPDGLTDDLPDVRSPAVVVRGERSSLVGPGAGPALAALWGRPVPQFTVPRALHHLTVDAPQVFGALLRAALDLVATAAGRPLAAAPIRPDHGAATVQIDR